MPTITCHPADDVARQPLRDAGGGNNAKVAQFGAVGKLVWQEEPEAKSQTEEDRSRRCDVMKDTQHREKQKKRKAADVRHINSTGIFNFEFK